MHSIRSTFRNRMTGELRGRILDCGSGEDLFGPLLRRPGNEVVSLDPDMEALRRTPGLRVAGSCAALPFADAVFDAVWACAVIEHVAEDTVPEMIRVARPGGRIIAVTPNPHSPFDQLKRATGLTTWDSTPGHVRLYGLEELRAYGPVYGELMWLPLMGGFFRRHPEMGHVLILDLRVTETLKEKARQRRRGHGAREVRPAGRC